MSNLDTPLTLTTADLFARVHELAPRTAVFDCDGTLWSGDAGSSFMDWTIETGLIGPERTAWLQERYEGYRRKEVSEEQICGEMVQVYAGLREAALREAAATFFREHIEPHIFPELQRLVAELQQRGTEIWAVSSTNDWVVEEGVRRFGPLGRRHDGELRAAARGGVSGDVETGNVRGFAHAVFPHGAVPGKLAAERLRQTGPLVLRRRKEQDAPRQP